MSDNTRKYHEEDYGYVELTISEFLAKIEGSRQWWISIAEWTHRLELRVTGDENTYLSPLTSNMTAIEFLHFMEEIVRIFRE